MTNPWDDLTDEELKEMVEFCQKYFVFADQTYIGSLDDFKKRLWTWKKGGWCFYEGSIELVTAEHIAETPVLLSRCVPLPLAHQWFKMLADHSHFVFTHQYIDGCWKCGFIPTEEWGIHKNPHYACYLAFRTVIENEVHSLPIDELYDDISDDIMLDR